ncbi:DUF6993 domain-containing protein [Microbacterium sp. GXF7504]
MPASRTRPALIAAAVALSFGLTACSGGTDAAPTPTATVTATPTPEVTEPTGPALVPGGTAEDNLPFFRQVVEQVWNSPDQVSGRAYVDALAAAGFDKTAMQVTYDESTVGNPAETIQVSVLWAGQCLLGQFGPATGGVVTAVAEPVLGGTACLFGNTRPIDW